MKWKLQHRHDLSSPLRIDRVLFVAMLSTAMVSGGVLIIGSAWPGMPRSLAIEPQQLQRFVRYLPPTSAELRDRLKAAIADTPPSSKELADAWLIPEPRASKRGRDLATARSASRFGIAAGVIRTSGAIESVFARTSALGSDSSDALGGLVGTEIGVGASIGYGSGGGGVSAHARFDLHIGRKAPAGVPIPSLPISRAPMQIAVAAGEWDDNANYHEFQRWLARSKYEPYLPFDVRHRRFLVVRDSAGRAVPRCRVAVADSFGHTTSLRTGPAGRAILFPGAEGLRGEQLTATAQCPEGSASQPFHILAPDGAVDLQLTAPRALPATRSLDVAFVLDTTGSMGEEIAAVKSTLRQVVARLANERATVRLALVEYRDRGDAFVTRVHQFSSDARGFQTELDAVQAGGGGDTPEAVNEALKTALSKLAWSNSAVGRFAFLIGDAPPHLDYDADVAYTQSMRQAAHAGIQIFTVAASGMDLLGQIVWRQVAQYTGGVNLFVLRGGAGPHSAGAGDPGSSCGGTHENFTSGNLDSLISSRIVRELRALDGDPLQIRGLHQDERAKLCGKRLASR